MESNRKEDMQIEREIASFLDQNLYSNKQIFKYSKRTDLCGEQISGSDIIISTSDNKLYNAIVDEKVAARHTNINLNTFALELSYINKRGNLTEGWFLDKTKITQYYLLGWIIKADIPYNSKTKRYETNLITKDNIKELEWLLVSRNRIIQLLEENGWTEERLIKQDNAIRERGCVKTKDFVNNVSFRYSPNYVEKPINILLKKETYIKLSDYHGKIVI